MAKQTCFEVGNQVTSVTRNKEEGLGKYLNKIEEPCVICGKYKTLHTKPLHIIFPAHLGLLRLTSNNKWKMLPDKAHGLSPHFSKGIISFLTNHSCYAS